MMLLEKAFALNEGIAMSSSPVLFKASPKMICVRGMPADLLVLITLSLSLSATTGCKAGLWHATSELGPQSYKHIADFNI